MTKNPRKLLDSALTLLELMAAYVTSGSGGTITSADTYIPFWATYNGIRKALHLEVITPMDDPGNTNFTDRSALPSTLPHVTNVTSPTTNGTYTASQVITLTTTFNKAVYVFGTPKLVLETGTTDREASYTAGSGSPTLTYTYVVQAGDTSADLDAKSINMNNGNINEDVNYIGFGASIVVPNGSGVTGALRTNKALVVAG